MSCQIGGIVGDYRIVGALGAGGMGTVYKVEHVITRRVEAMKVLGSGLTGDSEESQRFVREIQVQARLKHPNIAAVYNAFRAGEDFVMVMEYVEGESLHRRLQRGPIPLDTGLDYAEQVLRALAYAHSEGVAHRDVAPANIIITPDETVKLADFGLARAAGDPRVTRSGAPVGSLWYMSPEQVTGSTMVDRRTDIYSMGAVLNEILTGRKLFEGDSAFEVMRAHVERMPEPPSARNRAVPPGYDAVVLKALAKDPGDRYQTADEFLGALERVRRGAIPAPRRRFRFSGAAAMMAAVPALLAAGYYTVRPPRVARIERWGRKSLKALTPVAKPPTAATRPPAAKEAVPETDRPGPAGVEDAARSPQKRARAARRPASSGGLRITGTDVVEAAPPKCVDCPIPRPVLAPKCPVTPNIEPSKAEAPPDPAVPAAEQSAADPKPRKGGNRFVRVLGRINPFRKTAKDESAGPAEKE